MADLGLALALFQTAPNQSLTLWAAEALKNDSTYDDNKQLKAQLGSGRLGSSDPFQPNGNTRCGHNASTWYRHEHCLVAAARPVAAARGQREEYAAQQCAGTDRLIARRIRSLYG